MESDTPIDAAWLKEELDRPGRSQSALARHMRINPSSVNRIVNGKRELKAREAREVREYLRQTEGGATSAPPRLEPASGVGDSARRLLAPMMPEPGETPEHMDMVYQAVNDGDDALLAALIYGLLNEQLAHFIRSKAQDLKSPLTREDIEFITELKEEIFTYRIKVTLAQELRIIRKSDAEIFNAIVGIKEFLEENPEAKLSDPRLEGLWRELMPRTYDKIGTPTPEKLRLHLVLVLTFLQSIMFDGLAVTRDKLAAATALMGKRT